jgi:hypothetical protein
MAYKGRYKPTNPQKYKGDPTNIIYRSLLERRFMVWCDSSPSVLEWNSEEVVIPYKSPIDMRYHRYFVDFWVRYRDKNGNLRASLIEVKPHKQTMEPKKHVGSTKPTRRYLNEVMTWGVNQAKWKAATEYCKDRNWEFKILTEKQLT